MIYIIRFSQIPYWRKNCYLSTTLPLRVGTPAKISATCATRKTDEGELNNLNALKSKTGKI